VVKYIDITDTIKTQLQNLGYSPYLGTGSDFSIAVPWNAKLGVFGYDSKTGTYFLHIPEASGSVITAVRNVGGSWTVVGAVRSSTSGNLIKIVGNYVYIYYKPPNEAGYKIDKYRISDMSYVSTIYSDATYRWHDFYIDEANNLLILMGRININETGETGEIRYVNLATGSYSTLITGTFFFSTYVKVGNKLYVGGHGGTKAIVDISNPASPTATSWTGFSFTFSVVPLYYDAPRNRILVSELGSGTGATQALIWYNISDGTVTSITKPSGYDTAGVSLIGTLPEGLLLAFGVPYGGNGPVGLFLFDPATSSFTDVSFKIGTKNVSGQSCMIGHDIISLNTTLSTWVAVLFTSGTASNTINSYVYDIQSEAPTAPQFVLESLNPTSVKVKVGSAFTVQATIRNDGADGTCKVSLIDHLGNTQDSKQDTIAGGSRKTFTLNGTAPSTVTKVTYKVRYEAI